MNFNLKQLSEDNTYFRHEEDIMKLWCAEGKNIYNDMVTKNTNNELFVIMDGPPFVSGNLHPGHAAVSSTKSAIFNYKIMKGFNCPFKMGYDCHGLPIENLVCKEQKLDTLDKIHNIGLTKFNQLCENTIKKYSSSWTPLFQRLGRFADFDDTYMTRDKDFMESCIWIFSELWRKNLVYKGNKVMAYSYACQTPLSNFEASQNYKNKETKSIYVGFELDNKSMNKELLVAWTTTPWTLPSNLALCVNDNLDYVKIVLQNSNDDNIYILGKNSIRNLFGKKTRYTIINEFKGSELVGLEYKPLFTYMNNVDSNNNYERKYKVLSDNYVTEGKIGTAIVHQAPAFGEDDFRVCDINNVVNNVTVSNYCPLDESGRFTDVVSDYKGRLVFDCDEDIRTRLKQTGSLIKTEKYIHSYPYCWRTDTPLIYRTTESYYIKVTALKDRMIELNQTVSWHPADIGSNRFHQWLSNTKDWAISRFRFYGTPIPLWVADDGDTICISSVDELEQLSGSTVINLHPEYVNDIVIEKNGKTYTRIRDIFDCWFESGAVPFAQLHYPFNPESKILDTREYLSDFICEGMDQTRGWFYTLLVLSTAILDKAPYKNVMCTGMILDKHGNKFSKKHGNFVDPMVTINQFGSDILRTYFINSPLMHASPLKFDENIIDRLKKRLLPYINGVKFWIEHTMNLMNKQNITTYIIDEIKSDMLTNLMDTWLVSLTNELIIKVVNFMDTYQLGRAIDLLLEFVDNLTNWYIKFNRDRLKGLCGIEEWKLSSTILYNVLMTYCRLWAPFTPFLSEYIYKHLHKCSIKFRDINSVLLTDYPEQSSINMDTDSLLLMKDLQKICQLVRTMRDNSEKHTSKVVPLLECTIYHDDTKYLALLEKHIDIIKNDINCFVFLFEHLNNNVVIKIKPDRKIIGQTFRKESTSVVNLITNQTPEFLVSVYEGREQFKYISDNYNTILTDEFYELSRVPKETIKSNNITCIIEGDIMVSINNTYDEKVHNMCQIKQLRSAIQNIRKKMLLRPWHRITIVLDDNYSCPETIATLLDDLKNIEILSRPNDASTPIGFSENQQFKFYKEIYEWINFNGNKILGFLMVYYKK
jgi:isoleucyl-tRNA synthetase